MNFDPASFVDNHAYLTVLNTQWRMIFGNTLGMIAGFTLNGIILATLKIKFSGQYLWLRTLSSTFLAEIIYSIVCSSIAFNDSLNILELMKLQLGMILIKFLWEIIATPLLYFSSNFLKSFEGQDIYDRYVNFNPFIFKVD